MLLACCLPGIGICAGCQTEPGQETSVNSVSASDSAATKNADSIADPAELTRDWPGFRGPDGTATSEHAQPPLQWSDTDHVIWKTSLPGRGASSPIVVGNKVFVTAFTGYGISAETPGTVSELVHHLICLDRNNGEQRWSRKVSGSYANQKLNENLLGHGFASSTPVTDGRHVYAFFGVSGVHAFDVDGNFLWQADVGQQSDNFGSSASLTLFKHLLIVNASIESNAVYALNKNTGRAVWKMDEIDRSWSTPVIGVAPDGSSELVINEKDMVHGLDPLTGEELWQCEGIHDYVIAAPVIVDGICYLNGGREKQMLAIKLGGRGDVTNSHKLWQVPLGANVSSCIHHRDDLYVVSDNGILQCLDAATGELIRKQRLKTSKHVFASPVRVNEYFLLPTQDAGVLVIKADPTGKVVAQNELVEDDAPLQASIAISGHQLFLRTDHHVYCIGKNEDQTSPIVNACGDTDAEPVIPLEKYDFDRTTGRPRQYLSYFLTDPDELATFILKPYESVITDAQRASSEELIKANMEPFLALRQRHVKVNWRHMRDAEFTGEQYAAELQKIEDLTMKQNRVVRKLIKDQFSKEQMDQHLKDAGERSNQNPE
jgi:outer membrane protein assembly factor BamB